MTETFQLHEQGGYPWPLAKTWWQRITLWLSGFRDAQVITDTPMINLEGKTNFFFFLCIPSVVPFVKPHYEWAALRTADGPLVEVDGPGFVSKSEEIRSKMAVGTWVSLE